MLLVKAFWQLCLAIATAFINIGRLIITSIVWPITWLAERIGEIATSVQSTVERLEQKLEEQYPGSTDDPVTKIAVGWLLRRRCMKKWLSILVRAIVLSVILLMSCEHSKSLQLSTVIFPSSIMYGIPYYLDDFDRPTEPLNNFIAVRGQWCCKANDCSASICDEADLLRASMDETTHYGDSGASLKLEYNVALSNSLASYYESLHNGDTFYDLSFFDEFRFLVKGDGNTVNPNTKFYIRFADKNWNTQYIEIVGVSDKWEEKVINFRELSGIDRKQMREFTIIFENNQSGSGRFTYPLSGTLYFDNLVFVDKDASIVSDADFLDLLERRAFRYFWEYADPNTGLVRDRATNPEVSSIAATGFGLTALCIAKERGWITHEEAYNRVLATLNSFYDDPADPNDMVVSGTHGLFYHFVNIHDGKPILHPDGTPWDGVSTIDSALLMAGVLTVRQCFTETEIVDLATKIYEAAEWDWFLDDDCRQCLPGTLHMLWVPPGVGHPEEDGLSGCWNGYNEAMILYLMAIGSPTHPIPSSSWGAWAATYQWGTYYGMRILTCPPLFTHQYSHCWVDFKNVEDDYADYFRNSIYATLANRAYSREVWYPELDLWGITASDGPLTSTCTPTSTTCFCSGKAYLANQGYPPDTLNNNGTIAPTAAGGSIVFTPEHSISTLRYMYDNYHQKLWGLYGLKDSLNIKCEPDWFDNDYIGIDVGTMLVMIENYRTGLVWNKFMRNREIKEAMRSVGFGPRPACVHYQEAEDYEMISGNGIAVEYHPTAWSTHTLQIGPYPGNFAVYSVTVTCDSTWLFKVRYSDDVPGNKVEVYLDGVKKGSFTTDKFGTGCPGGWEYFDWDDEVINLGIIAPGVHTITLRIAEDGGGTWGVNLDVFKLCEP